MLETNILITLAMVLLWVLCFKSLEARGKSMLACVCCQCSSARQVTAVKEKGRSERERAVADEMFSERFGPARNPKSTVHAHTRTHTHSHRSPSTAYMPNAFKTYILIVLTVTVFFL